MNIYSLKRSTQIAIIAGAGSGTVEKTVSGTTPLTLSDSVAGDIRSINVKGRSEVSAGSIVSVGDAKWAVVDMGALTYGYYAASNYFYVEYAACTRSPTLYSSLYTDIGQATNPVMEAAPDFSVGWLNKTAFVEIKFKNTAYTDATEFKNAMSGVMLYYPLADVTGSTPILGVIANSGAGEGATATITTGLPLRSTIDGTVYDELTNEKVITRCGVVEGEVVPLATPVETPLSSSEVAALAALKTYDPTTTISITDNPSITVKYQGKRTATRTAPKKRTSRKKKS